MLKNLFAALFLIVFLGSFCGKCLFSKKPTKVITGIITDAQNGDVLPGLSFEVIAI